MIVLSWRGGFAQVGLVVAVVWGATGDTAVGVELVFDDPTPHDAKPRTTKPSKT
jgi:hypothetical protein